MVGDNTDESECWWCWLIVGLELE